MSVILEATGLSVTRSGRPILREVNVQLRSQDLMVIAGPNGSGKSTLLRALAGIWPVSGGTLRLLGKPLREVPRREVARILSYVPQDTRIDFGFTVREIVAMGRHPHIRRFAAEGPADRQAVDEAIALCDLAHLRQRTVNTLSGGERQRVLIARCLAATPRCILLDEPTASLDLEHALDIFALARRLAAGGCAVAIATHDINHGFRFATSSVILHDGAIAYSGPCDSQLDDRIIETVFRVRARRIQGPDGVPHFLFCSKDS